MLQGLGDFTTEAIQKSERSQIEDKRWELTTKSIQKRVSKIPQLRKSIYSQTLEEEQNRK